MSPGFTQEASSDSAQPPQVSPKVTATQGSAPQKAAWNLQPVSSQLWGANTPGWIVLPFLSKPKSLFLSAIGRPKVPGRAKVSS